MTEWEEQKTGSFWNPENKGEELTGEVTDIREGMYGNIYDIKTKDGSIMTTPSHKWLQGGMRTVKVGDQVKILFEGEEEAPRVKGQNKAKLYKVFKGK